MLYVFRKINYLPLASLLLLLFGAIGCQRASEPSSDDSTRTAAAQRPAPAVYVVAERGAGRPTTAVDAETGTIYMAWVATEEGTSNVYLSRLAPGANAFSAPVRVNDQPGDAAPHEQAPAQVVVGPEGTVYVAWMTQKVVEGRRWPAADIRLARSTDGGWTFAPAVTVNEVTAFPTSQSFHDLAVGPKGTVYVSWLDSRASDWARRMQGDSLSAPVDGGHAHGMSRLPSTQLRVAHSTDGGEHFSEGVVVARGTCQCCRTALAVGEKGTVYVAWRHIYEGQIRDMAIARSMDGGRSFSAPVRVHEDNWRIWGCPHSGPAVAVGAGGRVHVIWYTGARGQSGVYYAVSSDGGTHFGPARPLVMGVPVSQVQASSDGPGSVLLTWEDHKADVVRLAQVRKDGTLARLEAALPGTMPSVAAAGDVWVVAWRDGQRAKAHVGVLRAF